MKFFDGPANCVGTSGYDEAVSAANDLAQRNPGKDFFVLEVKSVVKCEVLPPKTTQAK